jgi:hypothetical protein
MAATTGIEAPRPSGSGLLALLAWGALATLFVVPVVCESLALEATGSNDRSPALVLMALAVAVAGMSTLAIYWRRIVTRLGNAGLATIASIASLQFLVSYASRIVGSLAGALLGPMYIFVDGLGSKGLSCLFLGVLVAILPTPGALSLALLTLFTLNVLTSGQVGLMALVFLAVSIVLHEGLAALLGVTVGDQGDSHSSGARWSLALRAGLAIGLANALSLYAQYALYEVLLRLHFDLWYKLSVSIITGLIYGGIGAGCGVLIGLRLRRTAP